MIHALKSRLKKRKAKLNVYFNSHADELSPEKKYQLLGALNEIDHLLGILEEHKETEADNENSQEDIFLLKPIEKKGIFERIRSYLKQP